MAAARAIGLLVALALATGCASSPPAPPAGQTPFSKKTDAPYVIVFVHGVMGDAESTWRNAATGNLWPRMIAGDPDLGAFDIYLAGYESPLLARSSTIEEIAQRLLRQITDEKLFERYTQIHFVTHSMGGLVAKRMLTALNRPQPRDLERLRRVRAVVFLSTPAQGADIATAGKWLSSNPQFANMTPATLNAFMQGLENDWHALLEDRDEQDAHFPRPSCAYETKETAGTIIVDRRAAATRCEGEVLGFDFDHSGIVKPADERTQPYPWVKARLLEAAAMSAQRARAAGREFRLGVQLYDVKADAKNRQFEARQFTGAAAVEAPEAVVVEAARWVTERLAHIYELDRPHAEFRLRVPADPSRITVEKTGEAPVEVLLYVPLGGGKLRVRPGDPAFDAVGPEFNLEISVPGYGGAVRRIRRGQPLDETFRLAPTPLRIGVEEFPGDPALGARLAAVIGRHPRIDIKDPATLGELRRELEAKKALIREQPMAQTSLREALGLDVLISGRYDVR